MELLSAYPLLNKMLVAGLILIAARIVSAFVMYVLRNTKSLTERTATTLDDTVLDLLNTPIHLVFQIVGAVGAMYYLIPHLEYKGYGYSTLILILAILWVAYLINRLFIGILQWYQLEAQKEDGKEGTKTFGFLNTLISILVWGLGLTFILSALGIDISALLAGLGIAGIAVALALQNTLSGVFSAVYLAVDRPIRAGDYIKLEDGTEGFVDDISMRSTRIKTFSNNLVIVPNSKLSNMVMTNFYMPGSEVTLKVPLGISYDSDLEKAEEVSKKVAESVLKSLGASGKKDVFVRFGGFEDTHIKMTVFLSVRIFLDQFIVRHEFIKALMVEFKKEDIHIPYPQLDVHLYK